MGRRRRMGRARDERTLRFMGAQSRREVDDAGDADDADLEELDDDAPDAELEDTSAVASGEKMDDGDTDGDTDGTAGDSSGAGDDTGMHAPSMGKHAGHGALRLASEAVLDGWEDGDTDGDDNESGERDEAVEGLTLRERRMAAQLAETRRQMAEMRYRLYETAVDRVLAGWDRQSFQFSVIESRVKDPRGAISRSGTALRRQGMIGLSRAAREAIREVMLSETVFRLSEGEREQIWRAFELALAGAVDLSARGGSFDQEERKTIRRGGPALSGIATEAALQEAAETLALSDYGKPLSRLTHEELVQVQLHAAEQSGYR